MARLSYGHFAVWAQLRGHRIQLLRIFSSAGGNSLELQDVTQFPSSCGESLCSLSTVVAAFYDIGLDLVTSVQLFDWLGSVRLV